ncbi:MAG: IPTL-CTERM sorting domain-containing protein [Planctomycetes bacterium]|nr:IPTL-CTERM sorting domain-containing protein [Planctomycetota bacterium]
MTVQATPLALPAVGVFVWLFTLAVAQADPPPGYYLAVDDTDATTLRATLHEVIDDHTRFPYTSDSTDTWDILNEAQEDPASAANILDVYANRSLLKISGGVGQYNREHSWPKSYGFPNDTTSNYPYTDCHQLFLCDANYNSDRSNLPFRFCDAGCSERTTEANNGQGGGAGSYPGNSNWFSGSFVSGTWETWIGMRGDIARAQFYLDVRYEGGTHGVSGFAEPDLILTDNQALIAASQTGSNESVAFMGERSVLWQWHLDDPVDEFERRRNDVVFSYQGNRNPFVDHPEWVDCLFGGACEPGGGGPEGTPWINEIHYDNTGADTDEGVEIAGPAGLSLTGWTLVGYNGSTNLKYKTVVLGGTLPDQQAGFGTLWFAISGLQNGSPDGVALIDEGGSVVEFLSYEGSFTAGDGPAAGQVSVDIEVFESNDTALGLSLQLQGTGNVAADFTWTSPSAHTRGAINTNQTFEPNGGGDIPTVSTWGMVVATLLLLAAGTGLFRRRLVY